MTKKRRSKATSVSGTGEDEKKGDYDEDEVARAVQTAGMLLARLDALEARAGQAGVLRAEANREEARARELFRDAASQLSTAATERDAAVRVHVAVAAAQRVDQAGQADGCAAARRAEADALDAGFSREAVLLRSACVIHERELSVARSVRERRRREAARRRGEFRRRERKMISLRELKRLTAAATAAPAATAAVSTATAAAVATKATAAAAAVARYGILSDAARVQGTVDEGGNGAAGAGTGLGSDDDDDVDVDVDDEEEEEEEEEEDAGEEFGAGTAGPFAARLEANRCERDRIQADLDRRLAALTAQHEGAAAGLQQLEAELQAHRTAALQLGRLLSFRASSDMGHGAVRSTAGAPLGSPSTRLE